jgi:hypothetical protein
MPVSHSGRFIFIHVAKAAGTSIASAFRAARLDLEFIGGGLWNRLAADERRADLLQNLRTIFPLNSIIGFDQQHLPAIVLREFLPKDTWDSYFKFAFVRNPWDLVVSTYHFLKQNLEATTFEPDIRFLVTNLDFERFVYIYATMNRDMSAMFTGPAGEMLVDYIGRFENVENDFAAICARIGIEAKLPHNNRSERTSYREYYTTVSRGIVERHFARDIERFGYSF